MEDFADIASLQFGIASAKDVASRSVVEITTSESVKSGKIQPNGCMDLKMGTSENNFHCATCEDGPMGCPGHFGMLPLVKPVWNVHFVSNILDILRCVCYHCSRILFDQHSQTYKTTLKISNPKTRFQHLKKLIGKIINGGKLTRCHFKNPKTGEQEGCEGEQPLYSKDGRLRIDIEFRTGEKKGKRMMMPEEADRILKAIDSKDYFVLGFDGQNTIPDAMVIRNLPAPPVCIRPTNKSSAVNRKEHDMTLKFQEITKTNQSLRKRLQNKVYAKATAKDAKKNFDGTVQWSAVDNDGAPKRVWATDFAAFQMWIAGYFDSDAVADKITVGTNTQKMNKNTKGISQLLTQKNGLIRNNMLGKRTDHCARTPISGDDTLSINQFGIPIEFRKKLSPRETVNALNYETLTKQVLLGPHHADGALGVIDENDKFFDIDNNYQQILPLKIGWKVKRPLRDGDIVLANRQPSLHRPSIQAFYAKLLPGSTFRLNNTVCPPFNADFDGDEMTLYVEMTVFAASETQLLMLVENNMMTPQSNRPIMGLVQNSLTGARIISMKDIFFNKEQMCQLLMFTHMWDKKKPFPIPCILKPIPLWSGKQISGWLLPENLNYETIPISYEMMPSGFEDDASKVAKSCQDRVNEILFRPTMEYTPLEYSYDRKDLSLLYIKLRLGEDDFVCLWVRALGANYEVVKVEDLKAVPRTFEFKCFKDEKCKSGDYFMAPGGAVIHAPWFNVHDTLVSITDGYHISGNLCKNSVGIKAGSLVQYLYNNYGPKTNREFLEDMQGVVASYLNNRALSLGLKDMEPATIQHQVLFKNKMNELEHILKEWHQSGMSSKEYEKEANFALSRARSDMGEGTMQSLSKNNTFKMIITAGTKGTPHNASQIMRTVGQQSINGKRVQNGLKNRVLSCYEQNDRSAEAGGFVSSNFQIGLTPQEVFFTAQAARVGLVDTAIKTSETGYMQRRLIKAAEDSIVRNDGTVRNALNQIVQFQYGEDGFCGTTPESQFVIWKTFNEKDFAEEYDWSDLSNCKFEVPIDWLKDPWILREKNRLKIDMTNTWLKKVEKAPINFNFLIKKFCRPKPKIWIPDLAPGEVAKDVYNLQSEMFREVRHFTVTWNCKFAMILRSHLASKRLLLKFRISAAEWKSLKREILLSFMRSIIAPGEAVGIIAGQSVGEIITQLTLNSLDWKEEILIRQGDNAIIIPIGEWIDNYIENNGDNVITTENGALYVDIADLKWEVPSVDEDGKVVWKRITALTKHLPVNEDGSNTLIKVTTQSGRSVIATKAKSFLMRVDNKITPIEGKHLKIGDRIPIGSYLPRDRIIDELDVSIYLPKTEFVFGTDLFEAEAMHDEYKMARLDPKNCAQQYVRGVVYPKLCNRTTSLIPEKIPLDADFGFFVGAYLAEGMSNKTQTIISNKDSKFRSRIVRICEKWKLGFHVVENTHPEHASWTGIDLRIHSTTLAALMSRMCGSVCYTKQIPGWCFMANDEFITNLLDGYFSGDGTVSQRQAHEIRAVSVSHNLLLGIANLLAIYGIFCHIKTYQINETNVTTSPARHWNLGIYGENARKFGDIVKKQQRLETFQDRETLFECARNDIIPGNKTALVNGDMHRDKIASLVDMMPLSDDRTTLEKAVNSQVYFDNIVSIEEVDPSHEHVYDLTVEDTLNFYTAGGVHVRDTFHSAGIAEKNVTLGVPRIKQIINEPKAMETPSMSLYLKKPFGKDPSLLKTIANSIIHSPLKKYVIAKDIVFKPLDPFEYLTSDHLFTREEIENCKDFPGLVFSAIPDFLPAKKIAYSNFVCRFQLNAQKLKQDHRTVLEIVKLIHEKYKNRMVVVHTDEYSSDCFLEVRTSKEYGSTYKTCEQSMHYLLNNLIIAGIPQITECYFRHDIDADEWVIETQGSNVKSVFMHPLIDRKRSYTNNILEIQELFGIESAKKMIVKEINVVLSNFSCSIDNRHLVLMSEIMCLNGYIMPITRFGMNNLNTGPLTKASFEQTKDVFKESARYGYTEQLNGCAAAIMVGKPANIGTGSVDLFVDPNKIANGRHLKEQLSPETAKLVEMVMRGEAKPIERVSHSTVEFMPGEYGDEFGEDFEE